MKIEINMKLYIVMFISAFLLIVTGCTSETTEVLNVEEQSKYSELIERYGLVPMSKSEVTPEVCKDIQMISSPEMLEKILNSMNVVNGKSEIKFDETEFSSVPSVKTRSEIGPNLAVISGSNSDGSASVYLKLSPPSVEHSTYHLGIMDAFVGYTHKGGSASGTTHIDFTAYGEGVVRIPTITDLYTFDVTINGYCDQSGNGKLTKF